MAWWIGGSTWSGTNTAPMSASGATRSSPRCTAPTSVPMAMANSAGRIPRSTSTAHQAAASVRSARGRTPKNFHSLRRGDPRSSAWLPPWFHGVSSSVYSKPYACFPAAISIVIRPARPASSSVPESGTTVMVSCGDAARHRAAVLEDEAAAAAVQRPGDLLDRDIAGRSLDARAGGQHLALAGRLEIAVELLVDRHPAAGAPLGLVVDRPRGRA